MKLFEGNKSVKNPINRSLIPKKSRKILSLSIDIRHGTAMNCSLHCGTNITMIEAIHFVTHQQDLGRSKWEYRRSLKNAELSS